MKRMILCSGRVNRFGYRNVPEGVILNHYVKNPVLLGMHKNQMLSIGKVTDIRIDEEGEATGMLTGLPEFDMDDPIAADYARKYEKGYMNACSMGHDPIELSDDLSLALPGQTLYTVTKTELLEISMTNIPGDRDAVGLTLSGEDGGAGLGKIPKLKLSATNEKIIHNKNTEMDLINIVNELGLPNTANESEVINAIKGLKLSEQQSQEESIDTLMKLGMAKGVVTDDNLPTYKKLAFADFGSTETLINNAEVKKSQDSKTPEKVLSIADQLKHAGGVKEIPADQPTYSKLSKENPNELLRIKNEDPELYKKLSADYAKGVK